MAILTITKKRLQDMLDVLLTDLADGDFLHWDAGSGKFVNGAGGGSATTDASDLTSGTLDDARLSDNVTVQGNTFNGASQLVQTDSSGNIAIAGNVSGANLTGSNSGDQDLSSYTAQGNTFNGVNQLVQLDGDGKLPALDASALINVPPSGEVFADKGEWAISTTYAAGDVVHRANGTDPQKMGRWICKQAYTGDIFASDEPGIGANYTDYWVLVAPDVAISNAVFLATPNHPLIADGSGNLAQVSPIADGTYTFDVSAPNTSIAITTQNGIITSISIV